jgi:type VI secretion system protein ImpA
MASPEVLDFEKLLAPIPGENPAGRPLRSDYSPQSIYQAIKSARMAARATERDVAWDGEQSTGNQADWTPVLKLGPQIIAEESKDLEVSAWLTEALVRKHGYAGLRDGFRLIRSLSEQYWENLYPLPDEDGVLTRVAPITGLNGEEAEGVLITPINNVPLTDEGTYRSLSIADYKQALELARLDDAAKKSQRVAQGAVTLEMFERAVRETPAEDVRRCSEDLAACREEFEKLGAVLEEKCGKGKEGFSLAPPSSQIRGALETASEHLQSLLRYLPEQANLAESGDGEGGNPLVPIEGRARFPATHVQTREEAFRALLQVADFFRRTEPHSPLAYALEQAVRWGRMPLPELWSELVPDESVRQQLFKLVGIPSPEEHA